MKAMLTGSFDPITNGHIDLVERALSVFDEVVVAVLVNESKQYLFCLEERADIVRRVFEGEARVQVAASYGMAAELAKELGAAAFIRGVRSQADLAYEIDMADQNAAMCGVDTVFFVSKKKYAEVSSSKVKKMVQEGLCIKGLVPSQVERALRSNEK